jgi:two-component system, cell cycle response regulator DivK
MADARVPPLVLVVEDDQDTRDMYAMYLDYCGMTVLTAASVESAFTLAVEHQPDVVVTDYILRGPESGMDLCRRLRQEPRTAHIPSLLMTGSSRSSDTTAALDAGCADVRIKPYLPDSLVADIREIIAGTKT